MVPAEKRDGWTEHKLLELMINLSHNMPFLDQSQAWWWWFVLWTCCLVSERFITRLGNIIGRTSVEVSYFSSLRLFKVLCGQLVTWPTSHTTWGSSGGWKSCESAGGWCHHWLITDWSDFLQTHRLVADQSLVNKNNKQNKNQLMTSREHRDQQPQSKQLDKTVTICWKGDYARHYNQSELRLLLECSEALETIYFEGLNKVGKQGMGHVINWQLIVFLSLISLGKEKWKKPHHFNLSI